MTTTLRLLLASCLLVACGGAATPPRHGPQAGYSDDEHEERHHGKMSGPLHDFHEFLAPVWHSTPGKERIAKACDSSEVLAERAKATNDSSLVSYTARLHEECADPQRDEVEAWLTKVHDRFHELEKH